MEPRIERLEDRKLVGKKRTMTLSENQTGALWQSFMPYRKLIANSIGTWLYSLQVYDPAQELPLFNPGIPFEKWAAIEAEDLNILPEGMEGYELKGGLYAVFIHHGPAHEFAKTFGYIFGTWLPASDYELDTRPHFERLPEGYSPVDPNAWEEIWIPIRPKNNRV